MLEIILLAIFGYLLLGYLTMWIPRGLAGLKVKGYYMSREDGSALFLGALLWPIMLFLLCLDLLDQLGPILNKLGCWLWRIK